MSALVWDAVGSRTYEAGVSKGVLYGEDGEGFAWNGLTAIESSIDSEVDPVHFDGVKFNDLVTVGDFQATMRAFTYPDEFLRYEGTYEDQTGFYITGQQPSRFGLSYQTKVGDDVSGIEAGYKLHILYNLTAIPSETSYETLSLDTEPIEFEWQLTSVPEDIDGYKPTAHVILDSRKLDPNLMRDVEDILYGSEDNDPHLPSLQALASFIRSWERLIIINNGDGTWTAISNEDGIIVMSDASTFEITSDSAVYLDDDSYTIGSSDKNEDDIWLP
jgi:hypothetical protein